MKQADFDEFTTLMEATLPVWGDSPKGSILAVWFKALEPYTLDQVRMAFTAHLRDPGNGKFAPKPAHIIEQIERAAKNDGRPGPEEAWAMAIKARDEFETVVWTRECVLAWGAAKSVMDLGDEVAARMAFRDAYNRLVEDARRRREPVSWEVSEGFDQERRLVAISAAVEAGRIGSADYLALQAPRESALLAIAHDPGQGIPAHVRAKLQALREQFANPDHGPSLDELERMRTVELKARQAEKTVAYAKAHGMSLH